MLITMHTGDVPLAGQLAVGGSAMVGAVGRYVGHERQRETFFLQVTIPLMLLTFCLGSTVAMSFVFSPYVATLERVPVRLCHAKQDDDSDSKQNLTEQAAQEWLLKATTRNMLAMKVETVFDPQTDIASYVGIRPFANFTAKGVPMYVHPDLILDDELRTQLVGEQETAKHQKPIKDDDDGFI
jgi:hypothetical protein